MKEDVDKTIPLKEETIVEVELTSTQKKYYRAILDKNREFLYRGAKSTANLPQLVPILPSSLTLLLQSLFHIYMLGSQYIIRQTS